MHGYFAPSQSRRSLSANAFAAANSADSVGPRDLAPQLATVLAGTSTAPAEPAPEGAAPTDPIDPLEGIALPAGDITGAPGPAATGAPIPGAGTIIEAGAAPAMPEDPAPDADAAAAAPGAEPAGAAAPGPLKAATGGADAVPGAGVPIPVAGGNDRADPAFDPAETP